MSHPFLHAKITKSACECLERKKKGFFPKYSRVRLYDYAINPDYIQVRKYIVGPYRIDHLNCIGSKYVGAAVQAKQQYRDLKTRLKSHRGAKQASWLSHFIVDCLEPMHQTSYQTEQYVRWGTPLPYYFMHLSTEFRIKKCRVPDVAKLESFSGFDQYIAQKALIVKKEKIPELFWENRKSILKIYEKKIIPMMVQAVASVFANAIDESFRSA